MEIKTAIEKAIEGGWKDDYFKARDELARIAPKSADEVCQKIAFLDPSFWQCLGKSMGWGGVGFNEDNGKNEWCNAVRCPRCENWLMGEEQMCEKECDYDGSELDALHGNYEWLCRWKELIYHLALEKSISSYFATL